MPNNYSQVILDVEPHLPDTPMSAKDIWRRVGLWAPQSVQMALLDLVRAGKAVRTIEPVTGKINRHLYCKATDYDAQEDMTGSIEHCFGAVRERVANGGPTWTPPKT